MPLEISRAAAVPSAVTRSQSADVSATADAATTLVKAKSAARREGEALPVIMLGFALLLRTMLATGASMSGKSLLRKAIEAGGKVIRTKGSHHIVQMPNGKTAPIPVHGNKDLPKGTLQAIKKALGI